MYPRFHLSTQHLAWQRPACYIGALKRTVGDKGAHVENTWDMKLPAILRGYNMSDQASTRFSPFYLHHGWQPKPPVNTTMIPLITAGTSTPATAPGLAPTNRLSTTDGHSPAASSLSEALRLRNRQAEIALANSKRKAASDNIARAQKAQEVDFNRRRNLSPSGPGASPAVNFKLGDLVLVRDVGGVNRLKPGEKAGSTKLRGAVKGPFRYRAQTSPRYCEVEDADGNVWDKAYDDVIPFDSARPFNPYTVKDFPVPTSVAVANEEAFRSTAGKRKFQPEEGASPAKRPRNRAEQDSEEE